MWIFPQPMDFSARNLKMTWTDKHLKEKENKRKRKRGGGGKQLRERSNHLSKWTEHGKDKRERIVHENHLSFH